MDNNSNNNEPVVLGRIKKGKTGKPLVVLILFLLIGGIIFILPSIVKYFGDYNVIDLIKNGEIIEFITDHDAFIERKEREENPISTTTNSNTNTDIIINSKAIITYNNFNISEFNLTNESITYKVTTSNNINFDESNYYLVLKQNNKVLYNIKLTEEFKDSKEFTFKFKNKLDSILEVKGSIREINEMEYPKVNLNNNILTCTLDDTTYDYTFNNNMLENVKETKKYKDDGDNKKYLDIFEEYSKKAKEINNYGNATIEESIDGFTFISNVDLNNYTGNYNNYYSLNTTANKVSFEMNAKGYDCK